MMTLPLDAITQVKTCLLDLQKNICQALEQSDGQAKFLDDPWTKPLGSGLTRTLEKGPVFSKAGVNFSHVQGEQLPPSASATRPELAGRKFSALGLSLVVHSDNPYVPTAHANVRFFIAEKTGEAPVWWFGGGFDLTPYYGFIEDCQHWHRIARDACQPFGAALYPEFKAACDRYFFLKHRQEARGVGGLFFDDYHLPGFEQSFALMQSIGNHFIPAYLPIVEKRKTHPFTENEQAFQRYRRGRYVEFNLVYDRGTLFGLQSGGRTESILMSLPPEVSWRYDWQPEEGSPEARLYQEFLPVRDWV